MSEAGRVLMRGLRLKCPACGETDLYQSAFRIRESCSACGLVYAREQGYFVGAIYINVMATEAAILLVYLVSLLTTSSTGNTIYLILFIMAIALPLIFFRISRSLWLSIDHIVSPRRRDNKA